MTKAKKTLRKTPRKTPGRTTGKTRRYNRCNISITISSFLKNLFYGKKSRTRTPRKSTFPYHVVLITTHGSDNCNLEDITKNKIKKVELPPGFQGGQIIRTGPIGDFNYCSDDFAENIKNNLRIAVEENRNKDTSIDPELFRDVVQETDKGEDRITYFKKRISYDYDYPIFEINKTLPERSYSIVNEELQLDRFYFSDSVLLLSENKTTPLMKDITGKSNKERIKEYSKDNRRLVTRFKLSKILDVIHKRDPNKKVIIIDYGCSGNISDRASRQLGRLYSQNRHKTRNKRRNKTKVHGQNPFWTF